MDGDNMVCPNPVDAFFDLDETPLETLQQFLRCKYVDDPPTHLFIKFLPALWDIRSTWVAPFSEFDFCRYCAVTRHPKNLYKIPAEPSLSANLK